MRAYTRLRYLDSEGQKQAEYALDRRDTSPRYQGDPEPLLCRYCDLEWAHSVALHECMMAQEDEEQLESDDARRNTMFEKMLIGLMARSAWLTALVLWLMARHDPEVRLYVRALVSEHQAGKRQS